MTFIIIHFLISSCALKQKKKITCNNHHPADLSLPMWRQNNQGSSLGQQKTHIYLHVITKTGAEQRDMFYWFLNNIIKGSERLLTCKVGVTVLALACWLLC